jgi:hypothetical protein
MVLLGHGMHVRADQIVALLPLAEGERGQGRRTYVHVEGLDEPLVASRSEAAILADMRRALAEPEPPQRRRLLAGRLRTHGRRGDLRKAT